MSSYPFTEHRHGETPWQRALRFATKNAATTGRRWTVRAWRVRGRHAGWIAAPR